ncbi:hypothetical protein H2198_001151 [Neophaeococcomyces mojaviensis]|uniref:Uncharacterized protein n=1 Tax=Neophaeococcomyces mojaviensis TaxID=3383035 RepID=A0ACC3AHY3_9EURO|nr:hypothetical protein H2198_001151 [Knufia sp. JES_112]
MTNTNTQRSAGSTKPVPKSVADETRPLLSTTTQDPIFKGHSDNSNEVHYKDINGQQFWCLFASIMAAYILAYFDAFFMSSSHPVITSYFNASNAASWLSTVFFISSTISGPLYGRISDVVGRRPPYVFALMLFTLTTAWCGLASSIFSFIAARTVCGIGAGGVTAMANIILSDIVKIEYRGIYQSYLNLAFGFGNGLGASMGGFLCDRLGWRAAFFLQAPFLVILTFFALWATPKNLGPSLASSQGKTISQAMVTFDFAGAGALTLTVTGLILGINLGGSVLEWTHPLVITALALFAVAAVVLVFVERRAVRPLLPLPLLSSVPFGNLNWGNAFGSMLSSSVLFNVPLFLQAVKQVSPTTSGLLLLSPLVGVSITSILAGYLMSWTRRIKPLMTAGVFSMLVGVVACSCLSPAIPTLAVTALIPWVSVGQGFWFPATTVSTLALSKTNEQAVVVTTLGLCRSIGTILGVAVSSWILQNTLLLFLEQTVTGDDKEKQRIISKVRKSVHAITEIDRIHRKEGLITTPSCIRSRIGPNGKQSSVHTRSRYKLPFSYSSSLR